MDKDECVLLIRKIKQSAFSLQQRSAVRLCTELIGVIADCNTQK